MTDISETDIAWAAGFFDGEGCIDIIYTKIKNVLYYSLRLRVTNTNKESIARFMSIVNCGTISSSKRKEFKLAYTHTSLCNDATNIIKLLLPYSTIKKSQFELGLQFSLSTLPNNHKKSKEYHYNREEMFEQMKKLKRE
jgi:hypothetical protein